MKLFKTLFYSFTYYTSSTISYCTGLLFSYMVFVLSIFRESRNASQRVKQVLLFGISGLLGSCVTFLVSAASSLIFNLSGWGSKIFAVCFSFVLVYTFRIKVVFPTQVPPAPEHFVRN